MVQTVDSVRKYLDGELAKCKTYKDLDRLNLVYLIKSEPEFRSVKGKGVDSVRKYLNNILEPFKNYNDLKKTNLNLSRLFEGHKKEGVGKETISDFLGGNWNTGKIGSNKTL